MSKYDFFLFFHWKIPEKNFLGRIHIFLCRNHIFPLLALAWAESPIRSFHPTFWLPHCSFANKFVTKTSLCWATTLVLKKKYTQWEKYDILKNHFCSVCENCLGFQFFLLRIFNSFSIGCQKYPQLSPKVLNNETNHFFPNRWEGCRMIK